MYVRSASLHNTRIPDCSGTQTNQQNRNTCNKAMGSAQCKRQNENVINMKIVYLCTTSASKQCVCVTATAVAAASQPANQLTRNVHEMHSERKGCEKRGLQLQMELCTFFNVPFVFGASQPPSESSRVAPSRAWYVLRNLVRLASSDAFPFFLFFFRFQIWNH